jgi:aspartyl aminopeptidase
MITTSDFTNQLLEFIHESPTSFHAVQWLEQQLVKHGFLRLFDTDPWERPDPGSYYVKKNDSSLIAFVITGEPLTESGLRIMGAHTDSPSLKIKPTALRSSNSCIQFNVEVYGGALLLPWFDRELSLAGRVTVQNKDAGMSNYLINYRKPIAIIPSLAIHLDREANTTKSINKQTEIVPIAMLSTDGNHDDFQDILSKQLLTEHPESASSTILSHDLFLYDAHPPVLTGLQEDFITGPRLDNLVSCYCLMQSLLISPKTCSSMIVLNDHEEVGSLSSAGAQGPLLQSILARLLPNTVSRNQCLAKSLFISADNAHAAHPNYPDKHDRNHLPILNRGPAIKFNANQRYATSSVTASFFHILAKRANVPVQNFVMRNDMACGSTIGPLVAAETGIQVVDVGIPSLAMHSIRETVGSLDPWLLYQILTEYMILPTDANEWKGLTG